MKRYDLMHQINARGTFLVSQKCIPHLKKSANPHVLNMSPPLNIDVKWFAPHVAYTLAKYGMCVYAGHGRGVQGRRHRVQLPVAAHRHRHRRGAEHPRRRGRHEALPQARDHGRRRLRDLQRPAQTCTGNFFIDDEVLPPKASPTSTSTRVSPGAPLMPDFFVPADGARTVVGRNYQRGDVPAGPWRLTPAAGAGKRSCRCWRPTATIRR